MSNLSTNQFNFVVRDVTRLSQAVGGHLEKLLSNHVILLDAPMGAGKTTFVSALSALLGSMITPSSPTFSICNEYPLASPVSGYSQIVHMDLYRFKSIEEILASGIEDYLYDPQSLVVIEWPELITSLVVAPYTLMTIEVMDDLQRKFVYSIE
ncbi:MAG TPA: tRNA (adenosine(37)-N6)-threonylcarbamoyltransferase complex ATPase subunit type 1 TsaE [Saprospiraceae bacterium]|nr:tRNA (adenosine(37)-N6)-threonylcarbamoyltransferase complex ATPase subunit type 1 TsaE [Saprospiraceae bacterium]